MSYLYNDLIFNTSTIISKNRSQRPNVGNKQDICPFCCENKHMIEKVWSSTVVADDEIRVINNKYPVCSDPLEGVHDVVIETKYHEKQIYQLSLNHWEQLFEVLSKRWRQLADEYGMTFIQIFKNNGLKAGASIAHAHWQIIALKETPHTMERHYDDFAEAYVSQGCLFCRTSHKKQSVGHEIFETQYFSVIAPFSANYQYETWIVVKEHLSDFGKLDKATLKDLGYVMKEVVQIFYKLLPKVDYNICLMSGRPNKDESYHFIIKCIPRMGGLAGFELATKCHINAVEPKEQAQEMNKIFNMTKEGETDETR